MRTHQPGDGPDAGRRQLGALAARLSILERGRLEDTAALTNCRSAIDHVTAALQHLGPDTAPDTQDPGDGKKDTKKKPPQRDWLTVTDPDAAVEWMTDVVKWLKGPGGHLDLTLPDCWPLHPRVVAELISLRATRTEAYLSPAPDGVAAWLDRILPGARTRITEDLTRCAKHQGTHVDTADVRWACTDLDPPSVATWWAVDRTTPATEAFQLTRR